MTSLLDDAASTGERGFVVKTVFRFRTPPNLFLEMALRSPPYTRNNKKGEGEKKEVPVPHAGAYRSAVDEILVGWGTEITSLSLSLFRLLVAGSVTLFSNEGTRQREREK